MKTIIANWKMNKTAAEAVSFIDKLHQYSEKNAITDTVIVLAPSHPLLAPVAAAIKETGIAVAAQNIHHESSGAYTGEVSAAQVADAGATYVLVGHSERRAMGDTDELIAQKMQQCMEQQLIPILCVGETREQRDNGNTQTVIEQQLRVLQRHIAQNLSQKNPTILIAYEPVWAIGGTTTPSLEDISTIHQFIKQVVGEHVPVLYGGSVNPDNSQEILNTQFVDGLLVGRASLEIDDFLNILA